MNLLLYALADYNKGIFVKLLNYVNECYSLHNVVFFYIDDIGKGIQEEIDSYSYSFLHSDTFSGPGKFPDYSKYMFYNECLPIDEELLKAMAPYEGEFMKMLDRRNLRSYEERWRVYLEHLRYWNTALDRWAIDCFIHSTIPHAEVDYIIYALCQIKHIKFIGMAYGFFPGQFYVITDVYCQFNELKKEVLKVQESSNDQEVVLPNLAKKYFESINVDYKHISADGAGLRLAKELLINTKSGTSYWRMLSNRLKFIGSFFHTLFSTEVELFQRRRGQDNSDSFRENFILEKYYSQHSQHRLSGDKYIYVPLNVQPEASTSPCGGKYADLIVYVELLSYYLPKGWWLYVKEHPVMHWDFQYHTNSRSDIFYDHLLKLKNVKLMAMDESATDLIDNAQAVAIIHGSAGMEGYVRKKPLLVFGHMYMEAAPKVYVVRNREECRRAMDRIAQGLDSITDYDIKIFLKAMFSERIMIHGSPIPVFADKELEAAENEENVAKGYFAKMKELFPR